MATSIVGIIQTHEDVTTHYYNLTDAQARTHASSVFMTHNSNKMCSRTVKTSCIVLYDESCRHFLLLSLRVRRLLSHSYSTLGLRTWHVWSLQRSFTLCLMSFLSSLYVGTVRFNSPVCCSARNYSALSALRGVAQ